MGWVHETDGQLGQELIAVALLDSHYTSHSKTSFCFRLAPPISKFAWTH